MAELMVRDGTWTFDGEVIRIVPGSERGVHKLRQYLGEFTVPLAAVAKIAYEPARKGGRLRLRLRDGADPLLQATGGSLPDDASPYQLAVDAGRVDVAEYFVDAVRQALTLEQIPEGPTDGYLLPGPPVPLTAAGVDGIATFDGERVHIEWRWNTSETKRQWGPRDFTLTGLEAVEWQAPSGLESGYLRFRLYGAAEQPAPDRDPNSLELWGFKKESGTTALLAAAVAVRLPHPSAGLPQARTAQTLAAAPATEAPAALAPPAGNAPTGNAPTGNAPTGNAPAGAASVATTPAATASGAADDHDALLRRLRELGELRRDGILTEEEFTATKAAVLTRFHTAG
ncbi:DUF4429 domain-containing protein [Streptomyces auratus]|uniref:DUF4429 domain-containing protein n=1 Tax=Streptomyces auratus AGR0001 TaxID=1160718 RepID=J1RK50_9ACTN|nr:DUF4429 domain-containing protein [Streptomyces auratus]QTZ91642.1 DUF4429 domain-containing protein [Streptomyces auratus AGR0001]